MSKTICIYHYLASDKDYDIVKNSKGIYKTYIDYYYDTEEFHFFKKNRTWLIKRFCLDGDDSEEYILKRNYSFNADIVTFNQEFISEDEFKKLHIEYNLINFATIYFNRHYVQLNQWVDVCDWYDSEKDKQYFYVLKSTTTEIIKNVSVVPSKIIAYVSKFLFNSKLFSENEFQFGISAQTQLKDYDIYETDSHFKDLIIEPGY